MKRIIAILMAILMCCFVFAGCNSDAETTEQTLKNITIEVIDSKEDSTVYEVSTDAQYLRQAMEDAEGLEFSGTEGPYGMMIEVINGEQAIYEKNGAYWSFYVNYEYCMNGIDAQEVNDQDAFQIVYTVQ